MINGSEIEITIRRAVPSEFEQLARLYRRSRDICLPFLPKLHTPQDDIWFFENHIQQETECYVALDGERLVGFVCFKDDWVEQLYLDPSVVQRGIGSQLIEFAKARSDGHLKLHCFVQNHAARAFYQHHGFHEIARFDGSNNEEDAEDILFKWSARPQR